MTTESAEADAAPLDYRAPEWVAERLGLDRNTVYKYLQDGVIPAARLGRKWLISEAGLAVWLAGEVEAQTQARRRAAGSATATVARLRNFAPESREVIRLAHAEARAYGHAALGQGHLLLGILSLPELPTAQRLTAAGLTLDGLRRNFEAICPPTDKQPPRRIGRTPAAKQAMHEAGLRRLEEDGDLIPPTMLVWGILRVGAEITSHYSGQTYQPTRRLLPH